MIKLDTRLPELIRQNCYVRIKWDNKKMWELNLPIEKMKVSELSWQFKIPFWKTDTPKFGLTPLEVIKNPKKYEGHYKRILEANLKHPIDIIKNPKGKWEILEGLHRLTKAKILKHKEVTIRKIPKQMLNFIKPQT